MPRTPGTPAATPVAADVLAKAVKTRNDAIKVARLKYRDVAAAKAERDTAVATAEMDFLMVAKPDAIAAYQLKAAEDGEGEGSGE